MGSRKLFLFSTFCFSRGPIHDPCPHKDCRIALINPPRLQGLPRHGTDGQNGMGPHRYPRPHPTPGTEPGSVLDRNRLNDQIEAGRLVVVAAGAEKGTLGNAHVVSDNDLSEIQQPALLPQPDVVAQSEFPWKGDFDLWLDGGVTAHSSAKGAQDHALERRQAERADAKQEKTHDQPGELANSSGSAIKTCRGIG